MKLKERESEWMNEGWKKERKMIPWNKYHKNYHEKITMEIIIIQWNLYHENNNIMKVSMKE